MLWFNRFVGVQKRWSLKVDCVIRLRRRRSKSCWMLAAPSPLLIPHWDLALNITPFKPCCGASQKRRLAKSRQTEPDAYHVVAIVAAAVGPFARLVTNLAVFDVSFPTPFAHLSLFPSFLVAISVSACPEFVLDRLWDLMFTCSPSQGIHQAGGSFPMQVQRVGSRLSPCRCCP